MANNINLTVAQCTVSTKGGHILKLQNKETKSLMTPFGLKTNESQTTYYMKVTTACAVGMKADLDLDQFAVVERPFNPDDAPEDAAPIMLKWLQLK